MCCGLGEERVSPAWSGPRWKTSVWAWDEKPHATVTEEGRIKLNPGGLGIDQIRQRGLGAKTSASAKARKAPLPLYTLELAVSGGTGRV